MSRSDAVQAGSGKISHDIHPRNLERESAMKSFLLIAGTVALLASAALPASAGQDDRYRPNSAQPLYVYDDDDQGDWQYGKLRPQPYPAFGSACGWNRGWSGNSGWGGNGNGWGGPSYHKPDGGWGNGYYRPRQPLPSHAIAYCVQQQRFSHIKDIDFDDGFYKVYARDAYGRKVKLLVDPYSARIVGVKYR
jgi:Peptidase propeptide and YPEB domain